MTYSDDKKTLYKREENISLPSGYFQDSNLK